MIGHLETVRIVGAGQVVEVIVEEIGSVPEVPRHLHKLVLLHDYPRAIGLGHPGTDIALDPIGQL